MTEPTNLQKAIAAIGDEIMLIARSVSGEQCHPSLGCDDSDRAIDEGKKKIVALRGIRAALEEIESGVLL